jgi:hypothetical protein
MGMTMRYEQQEGAYQPVQSRRDNPNATVLEANLHILKDVLADERTIPWVLSLQEKDHRKLTEDLLSSFMGQPSREEAEAYGKLLFSDDVTEEHLRPVAAPLSEQEIRNQRLVSKALILAGIKKGTIHESAWLEGSILRLGSHVADNLRHARWYKAFVYLRKDVKAHRRQSHLQ